MRLNDILNESPKQGWLSPDNIEVEILDHTSKSASVLLGIGEEAALTVVVGYSVDSRVEDHSFDFAHGSVTGTHNDVSNEGEITVTGLRVDTSDQLITKKAANILQVPQDKSLDPGVLKKYLIHAFGSSSALKDMLEEHISQTIGDELVNQDIQSRREEY